MKIEPHTYKWAKPLQRRVGKPLGIVEHHAAASSCTADDVHGWHLANGWSGIMYNAFISKKGRITRGRPIWALGGGACMGGTQWLGICYEGNFEREKMSTAQRLAGAWLTLRWRKKFGLKKSQVKPHGKMPGNSTACPGRNFPFAKIVG